MVKSQSIAKVSSPKLQKSFAKRVSLSTNEESPLKVGCEFQAISQQLKAKMRAKIVTAIRNRGADEPTQQHMHTDRLSKNLSVGVWKMRFDLAHSQKPVRVLGADGTSVLDFHPPSEIPEGDDPFDQRKQVWGPEGLQWLKDIVLEENRTVGPGQKIKVILLDPSFIPASIWTEKMKREGEFAKSSMLEHAEKLGFKPLCGYEFENGQKSYYAEPTTIDRCSSRDKLRETLRMGVKKLEQAQFEKLESEDDLTGDEDELVALATKKDRRMYREPSSNDDFVISYHRDGKPASVKKVTKWSATKGRKTSQWNIRPRYVSRVEMTMTSDSYPVEKVLEAGVLGEELCHEWWACPMDE